MAATPGDIDVDDLIELVGHDPRTALAAADTVVARYRRTKSHDEVRSLVLAQRAAGLALRSLGDPAAGEKRVRRGVAQSERAGEHEIAAEARMTLAFILLELGRTRAALTATDHALSVLRGVAAARVRATRALVLHREARYREAFAEYDAALKVFRRAKDRDWEARVLHNRGIVSLEIGHTDDAIADLSLSRAYSLSVGQTVDAADALFNMGVALEAAGDVPGALALFDRADDEWGDLERPQRWLGRVDAYLSVGLPREATDNARAAVQWLSARDWASQAAHAQLSLATCLLAQAPPDVDATIQAAEAARLMFREQERREPQAVAEYVVLKARLLDPAARWDISTVVDVAARLADAGNESAAADLRTSAGVHALETGDSARARVVLGPLTTRDRSRQLDVRTRAWFARALLAECDGDSTAALADLRRSWLAVETQRSLLGATELRAAASSHATAVVNAGSRLAVAARSAASAFEWAERGRSATLRYRPVRPPDNDELAHALARLRILVRTDEDARLDGEPDRAVAVALAQGEAAVVRITRRLAGSARAAAPVSARDVRARVTDETFVHYLGVQGTLWAVVVRHTGTRLVELGPVAPVLAARDTATFALRRILTGFGTRSGQTASLRALDHAVADLDAALLAPVSDALDGPVVVCPSAALGAVPWSMLRSLRSSSLRIAPSATAWCHAKDKARVSRSRVLAVAGPHLDGAREEVEQIARLHPSCTMLTGDGAQVSLVLAEAARSDVLHLAAHGVLRTDNPLFSSIELADGPLTGYDFESLPATPACVVLSACSSGAGRATVADESLGLAWTLMSMGSTCVVAPLLPVPDATTRDLMVALHAELSAGSAAPEALSRAQSAIDHEDPMAVAVSAAFVAYGA